MAILDGLPQSVTEWQQVMAIAKPFVDYMETTLEMPPQHKENWQQVKEGVPISALLGITKEEREAMLASACRFLKKRQMKEARSILFQLYMLYPYDARVPYTAAVSLQLEGNIPSAAKLFVQAVALDATNPVGYLRLGECFLAAKEYENAAGSFEAARNLCERGHGNSETEHYASKMLAHVMGRIEAADIEASH